MAIQIRSKYSDTENIQVSCECKKFNRAQEYSCKVKMNNRYFASALGIKCKSQSEPTLETNPQLAEMKFKSFIKKSQDGTNNDAKTKTIGNRKSDLPSTKKNLRETGFDE